MSLHNLSHHKVVGVTLVVTSSIGRDFSNSTYNTSLL